MAARYKLWLRGNKLWLRENKLWLRRGTLNPEAEIINNKSDLDVTPNQLSTNENAVFLELDVDPHLTIYLLFRPQSFGPKQSTKLTVD